MAKAVPEEPYLARATDDELSARFNDVTPNVIDLDEQGKICFRTENNGWILQRWGHLVEEYGARGGGFSADPNVVGTLLHRYFENGEPSGVRLFQNVGGAERNGLVKYSRRQFIENMYRKGIIRIAPASGYTNGNLLHAQQDLEVQRDFTIPTAELAIKGYQHATIEGKSYDISQGDVRIVETVPDYYVYCLCRQIDWRLPTDFESDAALVIHDAKQFQRRFFDAMREKLGGWDMKNGEVIYYDPYLDYKRHKVLEMTKHLRFYYQKEFRLLARPGKKRRIAHDLEPFFIEIGSLEDISTPHFL